MEQKKIGAVLSYLNIFLKNLSLFICTPFFLKCLGQNEYGTYQMVNATISNLVILNMGFSFAYIKFYVQEKQKENPDIKISKLNGLYFLLFTLISILVLIVGSFIVLNKELFFSKSLTNQNVGLVTQLMIVMIINLAITFFSSVFDAHISANEQFKFQQTRQLLQTILFPLITIPLLVFWKSNALVIVIIQTFLSILVLFTNINFCLNKLSMKFTFYDLKFSMLKEIGMFSFFIFLNQVFNQINDTAPPLIIGSVLGSKQVAVYTIVNQLKSLFFSLSQSLTNVFIPKINKIVHTTNNGNELLCLMIKIGKIQILILGFFLGGFVLLGKYFLYLWLGNGFDTSYYLLLSILFLLLIPLSQNVGLEIQQARNKHMFRSIVLTIFAISNVFITMFMVSQQGLIGATSGYIISLILGYGCVMNLYYHFSMKLNMLVFWKSVLSSFFPLMFSTTICFFIFSTRIDNLHDFILKGTAYIFVYLLSTLVIFNKKVVYLSERKKRSFD